MIGRFDDSGRERDRGQTSEVGGRRTEDGGQEKGIDDSLIGRFDDSERDEGQGSIGTYVESAEKMYQDAQELIKSGREKEGIGALERLLKAYPDFGLAHNDMGFLYYKDDNKEKSLQHYEMAARIEPEDPTFQKNLADFYYVELGRREEAMQIYIKILSSNPTDIETLSIMGQICVSLKKFEDAKVFFGRVLEVEPWNVDAKERLDELGKGIEDLLIGRFDDWEKGRDGGQMSGAGSQTCPQRSRHARHREAQPRQTGLRGGGGGPGTDERAGLIF